MGNKELQKKKHVTLPASESLSSTWNNLHSVSECQNALHCEAQPQSCLNGLMVRMPGILLGSTIASGFLGTYYYLYFNIKVLDIKKFISLSCMCNACWCCILVIQAHLRILSLVIRLYLKFNHKNRIRSSQVTAAALDTVHNLKGWIQDKEDPADWMRPGLLQPVHSDNDGEEKQRTGERERNRRGN